MGMDEFYREFQNVPNPNQKEIDIEKIYNKVITNDKKDLNLITDIPDSFSITMMETIADYLNKKYKSEKNAILMTYPITQFTNKFKQLNPAVNGKRVSEVLSSLSRFVEYIKNRSTIQKLTGTSEKENE
jgi:hypothetical protein